MTNWDVRTAAKNLNINLVPFEETEKNLEEVRGYSHERDVAINPMNSLMSCSGTLMTSSATTTR